MNVSAEILRHYENGLNWMQGCYIEGKQMCLVGALGWHLLGLREECEWGGLGRENEDKINDDPAAKLLAEIIMDQYGDRLGSDYVESLRRGDYLEIIIGFNDCGETKYHDVERVLEKLRVKLEEM